MFAVVRRALVRVLVIIILLPGLAFAQSGGMGGGIGGLAIPSLTGTLNGKLPSTLLANTSSVAVASTSDTSCLSSTAAGPGTTFAANAAYVGMTMRLSCFGVYSTPVANSATVTASVKWGSTVVATVTTPALPASAFNFPFDVDILCQVQAIGASGKMACWGGLNYDAALTGLSFLTSALITTPATTIDTTVGSKFDGTARWSTTTGGQSATVIVGTVEVVY